MKNIILLCLIMYTESFAQSEYNIELKKIYCDWKTPIIFIDSVETIIRDNYGNVIPPSNDFYYEFHPITNGNEDIIGGLGLNKCSEDNDKDLIQTWYVIVKDPANQTILGTSNTVVFQMETEPSIAKEINFHALRSNGSSETGVHAEHWMYVVDLWNLNYPGFLTVNYTERLRSSPGFLSTNNDKFHYWNSDEADVLNYNSFEYTNPNTEDLIANYRTSYGGVTIQYNIDGFAGDSIEFKDPWLVDYDAQPYGMRNQGINAPFKKLPSPFNPSLGSQYKGVLLNQEIAQNKPYYSISIPSSINLPENGGIHNLYLQSWDVSGASLEDENSLTTGVVFTSSNGATITANIKATQLSDNQKAFINNSQRKFIRSADLNNTLHMVYESMGHVWYEISTDNGESWKLMNSGQPLDNEGGNSPAIDHTVIYGHTFVVIVFQENSGSPPNSSSIKAVVYRSKFGDQPFQYLATETIYSSSSYLYNTTPVISINSAASAAIVWKVENDGFYCRRANVNNSGLNLFGSNKRLACTTNLSNNPTVYASPDGYNPKYHLACEERNNIYYCYLYPDEINELQCSPKENASLKSGYSKNYQPTITGTDLVIGSNRYEYIRLSWIGNREAYDEGSSGGPIPVGETRVLYKYKAPSFWSGLNVLGNNVGSMSVNKGSSLINYREPFAIAWSELNVSSVTNKYVRSNGSLLTPIMTLNTTGQEIQVNNSSDFYDMYVNAFHRSEQPFYFNLSESLLGGLEKTESVAIFRGREGVVTKDTAQFYFAIGDITLNGEDIDFVELEDSIAIENQQTLNEYLVSAPFSVNNNSTLIYGVQYGITDSASSVEALSDGSTINFKVELIDNQTSEVLGLFDYITYSSSNVFQYNNIGYQVEMSGIGNRTVKLKLTVSTNADCGYSLSKRFADESLLAKTGYKQITYKGSLTVDDYKLSQNYPNPFNPATTIKYQLPGAGNVTLKIYDILGSEVATLVDENQEVGRYEVNFQASKLASGVYLYRLKVNDFVETKKMLLIK